jgi:hypothetical protein
VRCWQVWLRAACINTTSTEAQNSGPMVLVEESVAYQTGYYLGKAIFFLAVVAILWWILRRRRRGR